MKIKTTLTTLTAIIALAAMNLTVFSQNSRLTTAAPNAAAGFSNFSTPQNLGAAINTSSIDEHPTIAPNGLSLYFASDRPNGLGGRDIYVSQRATLSSAWGAAQIVTPLSTTFNEVPGSLSPDGREMFFNSNRTGGVGVDLWLSTRTDPNNDFGWTTPVNLGATLNSTLGDQNANYFVDPATGAGTLIFASDRSSGTVNVKDFFQSTRNADGSFNAPTLINELNSAFDEARTAISHDGLEIFFSANRPPATTSQAMFVSTRTSISAPWSPPVPVGTLNDGGNAPQPALSADGAVLYFISTRTGGFGTNDLYSVARVSVNRTSTADFDGDGRADISVFRPADGTWYVMQSGTNTFRASQFGASGDRIVPGDYDGDGKTDLAVFRPANSNWYILRSSDNSFSSVRWGLATDKPVPADYDGDGRTDLAVYRDGAWHILQSSNGQSATHQFGASGDIPVAAANVQ